MGDLLLLNGVPGLPDLLGRFARMAGGGSKGGPSGGVGFPELLLEVGLSVPPSPPLMTGRLNAVASGLDKRASENICAFGAASRLALRKRYCRGFGDGTSSGVGGFTIRTEVDCGRAKSSEVLGSDLRSAADMLAVYVISDKVVGEICERLGWGRRGGHGPT